jgi:hypothetical protein
VDRRHPNGLAESPCRSLATSSFRDQKPVTALICRSAAIGAVPVIWSLGSLLWQLQWPNSWRQSDGLWPSPGPASSVDRPQAHWQTVATPLAARHHLRLTRNRVRRRTSSRVCRTHTKNEEDNVHQKNFVDIGPRSHWDFGVASIRLSIWSTTGISSIFKGPSKWKSLAQRKISKPRLRVAIYSLFKGPSTPMQQSA